MKFYSPSHVLSVLLLLVALTCATDGANLRARRSFLDDIENALNNARETIKENMKTGMNFMIGRFEHHETTTVQPDVTTTSDYRQIIVAPIRCPPNHVVVNKRCRLQQKRR